MFEENYLEKKIYRKKIIEDINKKINYLGVSTKLTTFKFLNIRLIITILIFIMVLIFNDYGFILAPILSTCYYLGVTHILLNNKIKIRKWSLNILWNINSFTRDREKFNGCPRDNYSIYFWRISKWI